MLVADFSRFLGQPSELFRLLPGRLRCNTVFFGGTSVVLCIAAAVLSLRPSTLRLLPLLLWNNLIVCHVDFLFSRAKRAPANRCLDLFRLTLISAYQTGLHEGKGV